MKGSKEFPRFIENVLMRRHELKIEIVINCIIAQLSGCYENRIDNYVASRIRRLSVFTMIQISLIKIGLPYCKKKSNNPYVKSEK